MQHIYFPTVPKTGQLDIVLPHQGSKISILQSVPGIWKQKKLFVDLASFPVTAEDAVSWKSETHVPGQYMTFPIRWCSRTDLLGTSFSSRQTLFDTTWRKRLLCKLKVNGPFRKIKKCYWTWFSFAGKGKKRKKEDRNRKIKKCYWTCFSFAEKGMKKKKIKIRKGKPLT